MKKNILIIGNIPPPYHGSSIYIKNLINSKVKQIYNIDFVDISDKRLDLNNLGKLDLQNVISGIISVIKVFSKCIFKKPSIVYVCPAQNLAYLRDGLFIIVSKFFNNVKIIQHLHGSSFYNYYLNSNLLLKTYINITQRLVDHTIVLGVNLKNNFKIWHQDDKISVVPNGIDITINYQKKNNDYKKPKLYYLGNLLKFKGIHIVIRALNIIRKDYGDIEMLIGGNWADDPIYNESSNKIKTEILNYIKKNNLQQNIKFLGVVSGEKKIKLLEDSDILVFPSINEGLPLVILEAMAAGNPVIAVDNVGAIPEVVVHNETGILVDEPSPQKIADAIIYLIENPEIRIKMGKAARLRYEKYYTFDKHIEKMIEVFNKVLDEK